MRIMRIFLAGATGVIGRRLVPLLRAAGMTVIGTTRSPDRAESLRAIGVEPVVVDMFDAAGVRRAVTEARPDVLIHQLTDLPQVFDAAAMEKARARNARLREEATPLLMRAAREAGVRRAIVQSICFVYRPGNTPHPESDPIDSPSIDVLETATLGTPGIDGVVLRYGRLWGPGTWADKPDGLAAPLHVDAAAHAAWLAIDRGPPGIYNIAEDDGAVSTLKAREFLGFDPAFRLP
jgi:nucleoside-diphosphate-sugar epimerase